MRVRRVAGAKTSTKQGAKKAGANKPRGSKGGATKSGSKKAGAKKPAAKKKVEKVDGGRYLLIDGRRWRATDPSIPEAERQRLVRLLMKARRDVGLALKSGDEEAEREARRRVHNAKVALGERGAKWWEKESRGERGEGRGDDKPEGEKIVDEQC